MNKKRKCKIKLFLATLGRVIDFVIQIKATAKINSLFQTRKGTTF